MLLLCGIDFAFISTYCLPSPLSPPVSLSQQEGMTRERGAVRVVQQAKRYNAMQQVIVSRNDNEEVWIAAPTGNRLAECFFKAPDETPEELNTWAIRSCSTS